MQIKATKNWKLFKAFEPKIKADINVIAQVIKEYISPRLANLNLYGNAFIVK